MKNYFLRHLQAMFYSLGQMWRQPVSSLMTVLVIGIALALPAGLYVLLHNVEQVSDQWDEATQISLFLQQETSVHQAKLLAKQLKTWPEIANIHYQSADESLAEFRQLSDLGDLLDTLPSNPLPAVIVVNPVSSSIGTEAISDLLSRLDDLKEVEQAQLDMEWLQRLRTINQTGQRGIAILGMLLSLSVLLVIGNTIRLAILSRESEIKVIKLVGGTNAFARRPFLYTGFWYGVLGGFVAWITLVLTLWSLNGPINQLAGQYDSQFTLQWLAAPMFLMLPITGLILGVLGAWLAVGRHLNAIEPN